MISAYLDKALRRARYSQVDPGTFCATVPGLKGVIATAPTLEACRNQLSEVIEDWVLVRVAQGLQVPALGGVIIAVRAVKPALRGVTSAARPVKKAS